MEHLAAWAYEQVRCVRGGKCLPEATGKSKIFRERQDFEHPFLLFFFYIIFPTEW